MQSRDPQPIVMQQHGGRTRIGPRETSPPQAVPVKADAAAVECAPRPDRPRDSD